MPQNKEANYAPQSMADDLEALWRVVGVNPCGDADKSRIQCPASSATSTCTSSRRVKLARAGWLLPPSAFCSIWILSLLDDAPHI
jgi:hypothetical protein